MAPRKRRTPGNSGSEEGGYQPPVDEEPQGPGNPDADPVRIHQEYIERRIGGGAPPTPEAYARALEQWNALPGAVPTPQAEPIGNDVTPVGGPSGNGEEEEPPA